MSFSTTPGYREVQRAATSPWVAANGGKAAGKPQDHGFMYDWAFYDLDGHGWGVLWMDPRP